MRTWCNKLIYWCILSSTCFGHIRPSSGALDVKLQHTVFCTEFVDGWWSWEPLRRSCVRFGWRRAHGTIQTVHTIYAAALRTTTHQQTRCRKPCTAPSKPNTWPTQRLSGPPPIYKLGAENHARHHPNRTHELRSGSQDHHPSKNSVQKTVCCNLTSSAPDDGRMRPKHVELRIHQ